MAYKVHNYQSGAKLFASQLNEMDNQIQIVDDFLFYGNQQKTDEWYAELEPYSISSANGQNTSSAYAKYYRTKGYLSGVEEIVVNGTTQIYNVMFYRADYSYIGDLGAWAYDGGRKLTYPDDAVYIRVCGYVSTTNDPINLASVFVKCIKHITTENNLKTYLVDKIDDVSNVANTLYEDINGIYAYTAP
ncbi:MAG: hypothetical protein MJZ55_03185 [Paludibacteraceae bacterium]|nr:hypothetical protein [Paludibacteraceae bacterium]